jgi:hypothetical protein
MRVVLPHSGSSVRRARKITFAALGQIQQRPGYESRYERHQHHHREDARGQDAEVVTDVQ